ncbi:MAG: O-antigen ligase family protein [Bacteroidota bacterium]|nr:O-antigen ligase family protein [Bacteroidota bacterium]
MILVFLVPLSIQLREFFPGIEFNLYLPTEPLMLIMTFIFVFKLLLEKTYPKAILKHPLTLAILFYIAWIFITSISSTMPLVSLKFLISRIWFIVSFYFIAIVVFKKLTNIYRFVLLFATGLSIVVIYSMSNLIHEGLFNQPAAHGASAPFFSDHTSFGAVVTMILLPIIGFLPEKNFSGKRKIWIWIMVIIFLFGLTFSYSRAAWISMLAAVGVYIIIKLKINPFILLIITILTGVVLIFSWTEIEMKLEKNRQDSSTNIAQHVQSISNISSDASNLERINRWKAALAMFKQKPFLGWGPGTYMFEYAGWQTSKDKTIISTNFGTMGTAHSEYLGPLSESGVLGTFSFILMLFLALHTSFRYYFKKQEAPYRWLMLAVSLGLISYAFHGLLNNFLDTDKASAPFWGFMAIIVALDVFHGNKSQIEELNKSD